jgi:hypothetical protein
VGLIAMGDNMPLLAAIEFQGDQNVVASYAIDYSQGLDGFTLCKSTLVDIDPEEGSRYDQELVGETSWLYLRTQLTAHPADGNFDVTDPPFSPMPTYGVINRALLKTGAERKEAR